MNISVLNRNTTGTVFVLRIPFIRVHYRSFLFSSLKLRGTRMEIHNRTSKISLKCRNFALSSGTQFIAKK